MLKKILLKLYSPVLNKMDILNIPDYKKQIELAYKAGYNYHQKLIRNDPELLKWVTKDNYIDV